MGRNPSAHFGPLEVSAGVLSLGPGEGLHVTLTPMGIDTWGSSGQHRYSWERIQQANLDVRSSIVPFPEAVSRAMWVVIAGLSGEDPALQAPSEDRIRLITGGINVELPLGNRHILGYREPTVRLVQALLDRLITDPGRARFLRTLNRSSG